MKFSFEKLDLAIKACSIMFASLTLAFYPLFHYWAGRRNIVGFDTVDKILTIIYCLYVSGMLILPPIFVINNNLARASAFIVLCEQLRLLMKLHSFTRENARKICDFRQNIKSKLGENDNHSTGNGEDYANPCPPFSTF
uniref:Uncharacterized protein n=1 Tax=Romanomermis culicivorax TaxID=13658 RepID=A0A915JZG6_ROMCU